MKHKEHICRFNDGEQSCDCYDTGYDKGFIDGSDLTGRTAKEELKDIHSNIRVLIHSELAFPHEGETAGSMAERLIPHIEDFTSQAIQSAEKEAVEECKNKISLKLCSILNDNLWEIEAEREVANKSFINPIDLKRMIEYIEYFFKTKSKKLIK